MQATLWPLDEVLLNWIYGSCGSQQVTFVHHAEPGAYLGLYESPTDLDILCDRFQNVAFWVKADSIPEHIHAHTIRRSENICRFSS